ncbi:MAG TPA: menaquinone biosynthesis protein [Pyrinomonadaceae bacterium]|nr:menaquinone biosynthesis protein [Pyrinomonadaceae bacterium]
MDPLASSRKADQNFNGEGIISVNLEFQLPRLAGSTYLNSAPLIWSFLHGSRRTQVQLIDAVPARCAALLAQGAVAAALVPVIEYQRTTDVLLVPDICVGSQGEVRSVVLVSLRDDLKEIRSVALDDSSRTSATLINILFREFIGHEPVWESYSSPDLRRTLNVNDGALIIGDPAMTFNRAGLNVWDLASLWRQFTGLGFVFAMWMVRAQVRESLQAIDFSGACDEGLSQLEQIAKEYASSLSLPASELELYLRQNISFRMDASMRAGLDLYYELAQRHKLIDAVKPLKTLEP